jgi:hypothetical protein
MTTKHANCILDLVEPHRPGSLLLAGTHAVDIGTEYGRRNPDCLIHPYEELDVDRRYDLGLVAGALEPLAKQQAGILLARLRDLHCARLLVLLPASGTATDSGDWSRTELYAYGLALIGECTKKPHNLLIFGFDIQDYKTTPDWLNSKYWAHPELFDKYRW